MKQQIDIDKILVAGSELISDRPPLGKKKYLITCLPEHIETIREFIKQLHKPS